MKKFFLYFFFLTISIISCKPKDNDSVSENFKFYISTPNITDTITAGQVGTFDLFIENKNKTPVTILDIAQSCNCTNLEITKGQKISENSSLKSKMKIHTDKANSNKKVDVSISIKTDLAPGIFSITKRVYVK